MRGERGSITLWALGLSMLLFGVGFLSLDLWAGFASRQQAAAIADSAAIAGATALDETAWRNGTLALDPDLARARAEDAARNHPGWDGSMQVMASATTEGVSVSVVRVVPFRFVSGFVPDQVVAVTVTAYGAPGVGG